MRRTVSLVAALLLTVAACGGGAKDAAPRTTTTTARSRTTSTSPPSSVARGVVATSADCPGIGPAPAAAEITWVEGGRLWAAPVRGGAKRCLLEANATTVAWGGSGDRVLLDGRVAVGDDVRDLRAGGRDVVGFSLPTGKVVLARDGEGALFKVPLERGPLVQLDTFANIDADQASEVAYHPAGTAIVAAMPRGARPGLLLASNLGEDPRWLVDNETASRIYSVTFTHDGSLVFAAQHEDHTDVHELDLRDNVLTTPLEAHGDDMIKRAIASPWRDGDLAVARGVDGDTETVGPLWVRRAYGAIDLSGTAVARSDPVAWLPDGQLLVEVFDGDRDDQATGDLYVVDGTTPRLVASDVQAASVRGVLPPPPPPPPNIIQAAPA